MTQDANDPSADPAASYRRFAAPFFKACLLVQKAVKVLTFGFKCFVVYPSAFMVTFALLAFWVNGQPPDTGLVTALYSYYGMALKDAPDGQVRTFTCIDPVTPIDKAEPVACVKEEFMPIAMAIEANVQTLRFFYLLSVMFSLLTVVCKFSVSKKTNALAGSVNVSSLVSGAVAKHNI